MQPHLPPSSNRYPCGCALPAFSCCVRSPMSCPGSWFAGGIFTAEELLVHPWTWVRLGNRWSDISLVVKCSRPVGMRGLLRGMGRVWWPSLQWRSSGGLRCWVQGVHGMLLQQCLRRVLLGLTLRKSHRGFRTSPPRLLPRWARYGLCCTSQHSCEHSCRGLWGNVNRVSGAVPHMHSSLGLSCPRHGVVKASEGSSLNKRACLLGRSGSPSLTHTLSHIVLCHQPVSLCL